MSGSGTSREVDVVFGWSVELQAEISPRSSVNKKSGCLMNGFKMAGNDSLSKN
jgi:hypothetical protein